VNHPTASKFSWNENNKQTFIVDKRTTVLNEVKIYECHHPKFPFRSYKFKIAIDEVTSRNNNPKDTKTMKKLVLFVLLAQFIFLARTQDVAEEEAVEDSKKPTEEPLLPFPPQCHYDFHLVRLNKGCRVETVKCELESQVLVQTMVGEKHEMCCCNYW
jgi:hypothetical protein